MHRCISTTVLVAFAATAGMGAARAAIIAKATQKDGSIIGLTDDMLPECNRMSFHGAARIERAKRVQPACWSFDWKKRVFTVIPLTPRTAVQGVLAGVMQGLGSGPDAALRELTVRYDVDAKHRISLPATQFQWLSGSRAPASPASPSPRSKS